MVPKWGPGAPRRRTVVHAARDRKARPDVACGGDATAMTMLVVGEAVEPRAFTCIYAHKNQSLHKRGTNFARNCGMDGKSHIVDAGS